MSGEHVIGSLVTLSPPEEGDNVWTATQVQIERNPAPGNTYQRRSIDWSFGPISNAGYVDTDTYDIVTNVTVAGVNLGTVHGSLKDGVDVKVNLTAVKGRIKFYLKNGNEVWIHPDIKVVFNGSYEGDYKLTTM